MKNNTYRSMLRRGIALLLVLALLLGSALSFSSCAFIPFPFEDEETVTPSTKSEIENNIESFNQNIVFDYVSDYLLRWGVKNFDTDLLKWVEYTTNAYYVEELPTAYEKARQVCEYFLEKFFDTIDLTDKQAVTDAIVESYVISLDDSYAVYRSADEYQEFNSDMSGTFVGIGVSVQYNYIEDTILVVGVYKDSGAELAGIKEGDYIYAVDGATLEELGYDALINAIRGEIDTQVTITVIRDGEYLDLVATRKVVVEKTVEHSINGDIGYLVLSGFKQNTFAQFKSAIDAMLDSEVKGIVFDVRSNPGGYLSSVIDILSYLVPMSTPIVSYQYKGYSPNNVQSLDPHFITVPCVVICNEYTASAGELFASALRDYDEMGLLDVTVVGKTTYGKGIMQNTFVYTKDNSSLTLTVAYYNPPLGENYHGVGVFPDVEVEAGTDQDTDPQYDSAIVEINKLIAAAENSADQ